MSVFWIQLTRVSHDNTILNIQHTVDGGKKGTKRDPNRFARLIWLLLFLSLCDWKICEGWLVFSSSSSSHFFFVFFFLFSFHFPYNPSAIQIGIGFCDCLCCFLYTIHAWWRWVGGKRVPLLICAVGAEEAEETMNMWECRFAFFVYLKCCYVHNFDRSFLLCFIISYRIVCVYFANSQQRDTISLRIEGKKCRKPPRKGHTMQWPFFFCRRCFCCFFGS